LCQLDNMVANAVSDSNAISTSYDKDNVGGSDYSFLADSFYTLVSEDVFTKIVAYYNIMNTELLAAYYELTNVYEAVNYSRLCSNPYFSDQLTRSCDIVCCTLTSSKVTSPITSSTVTSTNVDSSAIIFNLTPAPTTTGLDLLSSVLSASTVPTSVHI